METNQKSKKKTPKPAEVTEAISSLYMVEKQ